MAINLSAKAEWVNILFKGRATFPEMVDIACMETDWRHRLKTAITEKGETMRSVSLKAQCGPGYVYDVIQAGKDPTIEKIMRIADVLGVSLTWLAYGVELSRADEELLRAFATLSPKQRAAILDLVAEPQTPEN